MRRHALYHARQRRIAHDNILGYPRHEPPRKPGIHVKDHQIGNRHPLPHSESPTRRPPHRPIQVAERRRQHLRHQILDKRLLLLGLHRKNLQDFRGSITDRLYELIHAHRPQGVLRIEPRKFPRIPQNRGALRVRHGFIPNVKHRHLAVRQLAALLQRQELLACRDRRIFEFDPADIEREPGGLRAARAGKVEQFEAIRGGSAGGEGASGGGAARDGRNAGRSEGPDGAARGERRGR
mmetsp:Transcript_7285/g.19009  ORF Transcript_7285/g.19009 Transcript_7285/m.19009 type:complete len:237 (+) Transcript_7285:752-1462(+)